MSPARRLAELGVPFGLVSGLVDEAIPAGLRGHPRMSKPFNAEEVRKLLNAVLAVP
jgi:hypothetical protein